MSLTQRPVQIVAASAAISNVDSPLEIVDAAGYEAIPMPEKGLTSIFVKKLYCDYSFPFCSVWLWPTPRLNGQLEMWLFAVMTQFASLADTISLPEGYEAGLRWNLAVNLAPEYGRPIDQVVLANAQNFKASLVQLNASNQMRSQAAGYRYNPQRSKDFYGDTNPCLSRRTGNQRAAQGCQQSDCHYAPGGQLMPQTRFCSFTSIGGIPRRTCSYRLTRRSSRLMRSVTAPEPGAPGRDRGRGFDGTSAAPHSAGAQVVDSHRCLAP